MSKMINLLLGIIMLVACQERKESISPDEGAYFVTRVVDGDTFYAIRNGKTEKVRFIGIDAPETRNTGKKKKHPFGEVSSQYLKGLIEKDSVRLEFDVRLRDQYGRLLAYVYLMDGKFVNAELIRLGYATVMTVPPNVKHADEFAKLQVEAREKGLGFWGSED